MSSITPIQWCDSTVNPIMGCAGCELFPKPSTILLKLDQAISEVAPDWPKGQAKTIYSELIDTAYKAIDTPSESHKNEITSTNLYHLRQEFFDRVAQDYGDEGQKKASVTIAENFTCYAAKLNMNKGHSLLNPDRKANSGYAPNFEDITKYPDRMKKAAAYPDLLGRSNGLSPWKEGLPRMIFVSDMGDALSRSEDFDFLEGECDT
ncbi:hypothetical protein [Cerasicoccus frondis]|uniref:hypothetical protein n=1 Tax=Cerasicoccus frondis TaxID=490090 RepID=UPI0028528D17|nr:hypothetical protein [Cerasicoccus frondis]